MYSILGTHVSCEQLDTSIAITGQNQAPLVPHLEGFHCTYMSGALQCMTFPLVSLNSTVSPLSHPWPFPRWQVKELLASFEELRYFNLVKDSGTTFSKGTASLSTSRQARTDGHCESPKHLFPYVLVLSVFSPLQSQTVRTPCSVTPNLPLTFAQYLTIAPLCPPIPLYSPLPPSLSDEWGWRRVWRCVCAWVHMCVCAGAHEVAKERVTREYTSVPLKYKS